MTFPQRIVRLSLIGFVGGLSSGLLGVGGGVVMVPLLVAVVELTQHEAHATSLVAILPIAVMGTIVFAGAGQIHLGFAALLSAGSLVGAPVGARVMAATSEGTLKIAFGAFMVVAAGGLFFG